MLKLEYDKKEIEQVVDKIVKTRERVSVRMRELGFQFEPSTTNFLFVTHPDYSAVEIQDMLRSHDVYVRHFNGERISNYLRITIGTDDEMDRLLELLENYIKQEGKN